jgi:hypothetical protein
MNKFAFTPATQPYIYIVKQISGEGGVRRPRNVVKMVFFRCDVVISGWYRVRARESKREPWIATAT